MKQKSYHKQVGGKRSGEWVLCPAQVRCRNQEASAHMNQQEFDVHRNKEFVSDRLNKASGSDELFALGDVRAALESEYVPVTSYGVQSCVTDLDKQRARAAALLESDDTESMEAFIQERLNDERLTTLLNSRDETLQTLKNLSAERQTLKAYWEQTPEFLYESVRAKDISMIDANEELIFLRRQISDYQDVHAPVVARLADIEEEQARADGTFREWEGDTLNNMTETATFESGTREWLEQRQKGVGGSDVGCIMRVPGAYNSYDDVVNSKVEPITDEQVAEQGNSHAEYTGAAGRGNAWEKRMFLKIAREHPDKNITFSKASWVNNSRAYQFANFDGLMLDENGKPDGIVEIKTGSDASKWGSPEDGLDGVPAQYRKQVLWYCDAADLKRGMIAVTLDGREYREYHFKLTPELRKEISDNRKAVVKFNAEVKKRKDPNYVKPSQARGFSKDTVNSSLDNDKKNVVFEEVAALRGQANTKQVKAEFMRNFKGDNAKLAQNPEYVGKALRGLYVNTAKNYDMPAYVGVDLETAGFTPQSGHIIEFGATLRSGYSDDSVYGREAAEKGRMNQLYGLPKKTLAARGTGNQDVHGISESQISKKRTFLNPNSGNEVMGFLSQAKIMVAHNAPFETRWMSTFVPGFADALKHKRLKVVDTRRLTDRLLSDSTPNSKMSSFTDRFKVPYINSHRAYADAVMMCVAKERMWAEMRGRTTHQD